MREALTDQNLRKYTEELKNLVTAFDLIVDPVVVTDPNANILYANKAVSLATGFSDSEIIGKNPGDLWGGHMPKEFYEKMWNTIKVEKKSFLGELKNIDKSGKDYWQEIHISPVLGPTGDILYFIAIQPNISDRKRRDLLNEEFASMIGHQLKAPLAGIRLVLEWLLEGGGLTPDQKDMVQGAYEKTQGLADLVSDLLILRKLDLAHLNQDRVDLREVVQGIVDVSSAQFSGKKLSFNFDPSENYAVLAHTQLVKQIFINLITNAIEYSAVSQGAVTIELQRTPGKILFSCRDNGPGIPLEDQRKIFSKFFRASNASEMKQNGTGLGLFLVKMICDGFKWNVSFTSEPGNGTTFVVEISV